MNLETLSSGEITITLIALTCLLTGALLVGKLFERIQAPKVVGEIIGGMLFGATFIGAIAPNLMEQVFKGFPEEGKVLNIFYQLGLCFLMFSSGYNTKIDLQKNNSRIFFALFVGSTLIPMLLGIPFVKFFQPYFIGEKHSSTAFWLVFLIGIAITSIPVISKIFFDIGIMNTRFTNIVLTAATLQDLCLWVLLNTAIELAASQTLDLVNMCIVIFLTIALFLIARFVAEKLKERKFSVDGPDFLQVCLIGLFFLVAVLSYLKINIMYSAFLAGYLVKGLTAQDPSAKEKIESVRQFAFSFFIPIYFALVGIQLDLLHHFSLLRFLLFFLLAFALEWIGTVLLLKLVTNLNKRTIWNFGITMNARGGPGIVLATVAYDHGIINIEFFVVLILTTMLSSLIAGYWLRLQKKKDEQIFDELI